MQRQKSKLIDHLFTADDYGTQKIWDPTRKIPLKSINGAHYGTINGMILDPDDKYLFTYGEYGSQKQWSTECLDLVHDWGTVHEAQLLRVVVSENGLVITACDLCHLKAWDLESRMLMHEYTVPKEYPIVSMVVCSGSNLLFTADRSGRLRQFLIKASAISYDSGQIHNCPITSMIMTNDSRFQFTGDRFGHLKSWELTKFVPNFEADVKDVAKNSTKYFYDVVLFKDYGKEHEGIIYDIKFSLDNDFLQTAGGLGNLKRMKQEFGESGQPNGNYHGLKAFNKGVDGEDEDSKAFSKAHDAQILAICISNNGDIFTVGHKGHLKQWTTGSLKQVHDWGKVHSGRITSAAISHFY